MAQQGEYVFDDCVPNAAIILAAIAGDAEQSRDWSFAANKPPKVQKELDNGDWRAGAIVRGMDGRLYGPDGAFLAQCPEWTMTLNPDSSEYRAAGKFFKWTILNGATAVITLKETIYKDADLLMRVINEFADESKPPNISLSFLGIITTRG